MVSEYQQFIKAHFKSLPAHMSSKQKMAELGKMWREKSGSMPKAVKGKKAPARKAAKKEKGGSIFGDIIPFGHMIGLGLEEKKKMKKAPAKKGRKAAKKQKGGSLLGEMIPFGHMLGLGLEEKKKGGRRRVHGGMISGAGVSGGIMTAAGLHEPKPLSRPLRGYSVHENPEHMHAGSFGDMFFKGLTMPFRVASAIPIPGLQQIGQAGSKVFDAIGI